MCKPAMCKKCRRQRTTAEQASYLELCENCWVESFTKGKDDQPVRSNNLASEPRSIAVLVS